MNFLLEHISIDLQEENGHIPLLAQYEKAFLNALPVKFSSGKPFIIGTEVFQEIGDRFFADIKIDVTITRLTDVFGPNITSRSYYNSEYKDYIGKDGKLHGLEIVIDLGVANGSEIRKHLTKIFEHELLHAYQSYKERTDTNTAPLRSRIVKSGYGLATQRLLSGTKGGRGIAAFTYLMTDFERNANLGALRAELKDKAKELKDTRDLSKILNQLFTFRQYYAAESFVDEIRTSSEWMKNPQYLRQINLLTGHTFSTAKRARQWILDTWNKWDRKFKNTVGKVIWEVIQEYDLEKNAGKPDYGVDPYRLFDEFVNQDQYWEK